MDNIFLSELKIEHVRHLKNITISLSDKKIKHLILTGKNGSGKTSVLEALARYLDEERLVRLAGSRYDSKHGGGCRNEDGTTAAAAVQAVLNLTFNQSLDAISTGLMRGEFVMAYYKAERLFRAEVPKHIEKVDLKDKYAITDGPGREVIRYLLDLKATEAFARNNGKGEKADEIKRWFDRFRDLLRKIFNDDSLELIFEEDTFSFHIKEKDKELFDFNTLSGGYGAVLDIVLDMMMRMEKKTKRSFDFNVPGIVLVDEIETHLHIELQKAILRLLTTIFPNIQFIVSTHSPFILGSIQDAVIYDLEKNILVENGLADIPYGGIVEGYFQSSEMSKILEEKFTRYKQLVGKANLTDDDFEEIAELEMFLNEIPDYLALNITTEYQRLKLELGPSLSGDRSTKEIRRLPGRD